MSTRIEDMTLPAEVIQLVRTVGRLPADDQRRILRIVDLMLVAPQDVRSHTQRMLRDLVDRQPESKAECVSGVEEIIMYLEHRVVPFRLTAMSSASHH